MRMNRRQFTGHLVGGGALVLVGATGGLVGCSASTAIGELETYFPIGLAAFDGVAAFVDTVFTVIAATVDGLWATLSAAIANYQHSADPTVTTLDKVIAALDAVNSGLASAIANLPISIPAAVMTAAKLGLGLLLATLKSIQSKLEPTPTPAPASMKAAMNGVAPAKDGKDFIKKFNAIMATNGQKLRVK